MNSSALLHYVSLGIVAFTIPLAGALFSSGQNPPDRQDIGVVELCTLIDQPQAYSGKIVITKARLMRGNAYYLHSPPCISDGDILLVLPQSMSDAAPFTLVQNELLKQLFAPLDAPYIIDVTVAGRFEHYKHVKSDKKKRFGRRRKFEMRFIVREVLDLKLRRMYPVD